MPLVKLFRVTDVNGERWHIAAPSFSAAVQAMSDWENQPHDSDDELVRSVTVVEDLIHGGTREDDIRYGDHILTSLDAPVIYRPDVLAARMEQAITEFLAVSPGDHAGSFASVDPEAFFDAIDKMKKAAEDYGEIPF